MAQIFHRSANTISRVSIFGALFVIVGLLFLAAAIQRSPWITQAIVPGKHSLVLPADTPIGTGR